MSIDIKAIIAEAFLALCENKMLKKITIEDILQQCGASRKTFYHHFKDKYDLIQYCYDTKIIPQWNYEITDKDEINRWRIEWFCAIQRHGRFMKEACMMEGQNCLWKYIVAKGRTADLEWYEAVNSTPLTEEMKKSIWYHSGACRYMIIEWILADMPISAEELSENLNKNSNILMRSMMSEERQKE